MKQHKKAHSVSFHAPQATTVNTTEPLQDQYTIGFAPELIEFILENKKLTTYRYGNKYAYLAVGDLVTFQNSTTGQNIGMLRIIAKRETTLRDLPLEDPTHEAYQDKEHQRKVLSGYYAYIGRQLQADDPFLAFDFELVSLR